MITQISIPCRFSVKTVSLILVWNVLGLLGVNGEADPSPQRGLPERSDDGSFELSILDTGLSGVWLKSIGDLDGDGRMDIIAGAQKQGGLISYLNRFPDWQRSPIDLTHSFSTDGEAADVNGDGTMDFVAILNGPEKGLVWYANTGSGWKLVRVNTDVWHDVEVGDLDGDGWVDLVGRNQKEWPAKEDNGNQLHLEWQQRDARGHISWKSETLRCPPGEGLLTADVDGDQDLDILTNGIWFENLDGRRWAQHAFATEADWSHPNTFIAMGDINGDGRDDILLSPSELNKSFYKVSWFEAPEDRTQPWKEHTIDPEVEAVLHFIGTADFDGDGRIDVAIAEMTQSQGYDRVQIYYNRGQSCCGIFHEAWRSSVLSRDGSHSMRILDVNGDGRPDLFGANWNAGGPECDVKLWVNQTASGK